MIGTGPAWSSTTSRGTGAGTTQIQVVGGVWVNANAMTLRLGTGGSNTVSIAAQMALYLGTMYATANGQTAMQFAPSPASGGTNNFLGLYNAYNRARVVAWSEDSNSWTYASNTWRAADNSNSNRVTWIDGLGQTNVDAAYTVTVAASAGDARFGVAFDSTTASPIIYPVINGPTYASAVGMGRLVSLGLHYAQAMELVPSGTVTFFSYGLGQLRAVLEM